MGYCHSTVKRERDEQIDCVALNNYHLFDQAVFIFICWVSVLIVRSSSSDQECGLSLGTSAYRNPSISHWIIGWLEWDKFLCYVWQKIRCPSSLFPSFLILIHHSLTNTIYLKICIHDSSEKSVVDLHRKYSLMLRRLKPLFIPKQRERRKQYFTAIICYHIEFKDCVQITSNKTPGNAMHANQI